VLNTLTVWQISWVDDLMQNVGVKKGTNYEKVMDVVFGRDRAGGWQFGHVSAGAEQRRLRC
jgi:hypothetical protein